MPSASVITLAYLLMPPISAAPESCEARSASVNAPIASEEVLMSRLWLVCTLSCVFLATLKKPGTEEEVTYLSSSSVSPTVTLPLPRSVSAFATPVERSIM